MNSNATEIKINVPRLSFNSKIPEKKKFENMNSTSNLINLNVSSGITSSTAQLSKFANSIPQEAPIAKDNQLQDLQKLRKQSIKKPVLANSLAVGGLLLSDSEIIVNACEQNESEIISKVPCRNLTNSYLFMKIVNSEISNELLEAVSNCLTESKNAVVDLLEKNSIRIGSQPLNYQARSQTSKVPDINTLLRRKLLKNTEIFIEEIKSRLAKVNEDMFILENTDFVAMYCGTAISHDKSSPAEINDLLLSLGKQPGFAVLKQRQGELNSSKSSLEAKLNALEEYKSQIENEIMMNDLNNPFDNKLNVEEYLKKFDKDTSIAEEKVKNWKKLRVAVKLRMEEHKKKQIQKEQKLELEAKKKAESEALEKEEQYRENLEKIKEKNQAMHNEILMLKDSKLNDTPKVQPKYSYRTLEENFNLRQKEEAMKRENDFIKHKLQIKQKLKRVSIEKIREFQEKVQEKLEELNEIKSAQRQLEMLENKEKIDKLKERLNCYEIKGNYKNSALQSDTQELQRLQEKQDLLRSNREKLKTFISMISLPKIKAKETDSSLKELEIPSKKKYSAMIRSKLNSERSSPNKKFEDFKKSIKTQNTSKAIEDLTKSTKSTKFLKSAKLSSSSTIELNSYRLSSKIKPTLQAKNHFKNLSLNIDNLQVNPNNNSNTGLETAFSEKLGCFESEKLKADQLEQKYNFKHKILKIQESSTSFNNEEWELQEDVSNAILEAIKFKMNLIKKYKS